MTQPALDDEPLVLVLADRIHTLSQHADARALLIRHGRIAAVGQPDALRGLATRAAVLDLRGSTITPGLADAHIHLTEWAMARRDVDLADAASPDDAAGSVARHTAASHGWIRGRGWNPHRWHGRQPHRDLLDAVVPDRPVALQSHDMHALWVNGAALRAAGIDETTPDPDGGRIVRDPDGRPTGLLLESAAALAMRACPVPAPDDVIAAVHDAQAELHTLGITAVHSFPGIHLPEPDPLPVLLRMRETRSLRLRVLQHIRLDRFEHAAAMGLRSGFGDDWLRIGGLKMFLDGALGSRTAWMREPYESDSGCGLRTMDPTGFRDRVRDAAAAGIATTVHAIGDAAVCLALDVLSDPAVRGPAIPHRIEHLQCCPPERFGDAAAAGIVCSMQPSHLITDWSIAERHWGALRSRGAFALASLLRAGTVLAFGSDAPVEPVDPRRTLFAAVSRRDLDGRPEHGWVPEERISPLDALRGCTIGPARAAGLPAPHGTLAPGAPADLAAWDHDPLACPADVLPHIRCVATFVAGVLVHD